MLRKFLSSTIAFSLAFAPMAQADGFFFRYRTALVDQSSPELPDEQYGVGNDIRAYYTAPMGYAFAKRIPVATQDVVDWRKDSGEWPDGIELDESTGEMTGSPAAVETQTLLYHGYDASGNRIARALIKFSIFQPVGVGAEVDYYAHTDKYFYQQLPIPDGVDVYRWDAVTEFPAGVSATGLALQGTPEAKGEYSLAFRGYDFMGREVAFLYGTLLVQDGPVIETIDDQQIDLLAGETFEIQPIVARQIGATSYSLVPETARPQGLSFTSSTGKLSGAYTTYDTSATFHIVARDASDGTSGVSNSFTLSTLPASVDLTSLGDQQGAVNSPFSLQLAFPGVQSSAKWVLKSGSWPSGVALDADTGLISGTPTKTETVTGLVIELSGPSMTTVQSPAFSFTVFPEKLTAKLAPLIARTGTAFSTTQPTILTGDVAPITYSVKASSAGFAKMAAKSLISLDPSTGKVVSDGVPLPGSYGVTMIATNGEGQKSPALVQGIDVFNPLEVAYAPEKGRRLQAFSVGPVIPDDSVAAPAKFRLASGTLPSWLTFDSGSGRLSGTPISPASIGPFGPFEIEISDRSGDKARSNAFSIVVDDRQHMTVQLVDSSAERFVGNARQSVSAENAWNGATWSVKSGSFPSSGNVTLAFTDDGYLSGTTNDPVGTQYGPFVLTAIDGDGEAKDVGPFSVTVIEPAELKPLAGSFDTSLAWTKGVPFALDLPKLSNAYGTPQYSFTASEPDLVIKTADGHVSGLVNEAGTTTHAFTVKDATDRAPVGGNLTLVMTEPMSVTADDVYVGNQGTAAKFKPLLNNAIGKVTYSSLSGPDLPRGLAYAKGIISGTPTTLGKYGPYSFTATDATGTTATASFEVKVEPPLPFSFAYSTSLMTSGIWSNRPPKTVNSIGTVEYSLLSGTLPKGVQLGNSKTDNGHLVGTPREFGRFPGITIRGIDPNYDATSTADDMTWIETFDLGVKPYYQADVPDQTFTVRRGVASSNVLQTTDTVAPLTFASKAGSTLPYDFAFDASTGALRGTYPDAGTFKTIQAEVTDTFNRKGSGTITYKVLEPVVATYPATASFNQHMTSSVAPLSTGNRIGTLSFELDPSSAALPSGLSVNSATGAIEGTPAVQGDIAGIVVQVTDSFDGIPQKSNPFAVHVEERLPFSLVSPGTVILKRWQNSTAKVPAVNPIGATIFSISPALPAGFLFNTSTGAITGFSADLISESTYSVSATDSMGAKDSVAFTLRVDERDPLRIKAADSFEFAQFFNGTFAAEGENVIGTPVWSISPAVPAWATFADGAFSGTPQVRQSATTYTVHLSDDHDSAPSKTVSISVGERRPLKIAEPLVVAAVLNSQIKSALSATDSVGPTTWKYISGTLPTGVFFDDATGSFGGVPTAYGAFSGIVISASDAFGGYDQQSLTVDVQADSTAVSMTVASASAHEGKPFTGSTPVVGNAIGTVQFSATGLAGTGLSIDQATGVISGTPASAGTITPIIAVTDIAGRKAVVVAQINILPELQATAPSSMRLVFNYVPGEEASPTAQNAVSPSTWSVASGALPAGVTVDPSTGKLVGKPKALGTFTAVLRITDATGVTADTAPISINVKMNDDPIALSVSDFTTHVGYPAVTAAPIYDNNVGAVTFFSTDANTYGLTLDPVTGVLSGKIDQTLDAFVNVSVMDSGTSRVTSKPVHVMIVPPQQITAPSVVLLTVNENTNKPFLTRQYAVGTATWSQISNSLALPQGIDFDPATGNIVGTATTLGTYGPFTVTSTDSTGDVKTSNSFSLQVTTGSAYLGLAQGPVTAGVKRSAYPGFDFTSLLTAVGIDPSEMTWSLTADKTLNEALPAGLAISSSGQLEGTPTLEGSFTFKVKAMGGGMTATQSYTINVTLPQTALTLAATTLPEAGLKIAYSNDFSQYVTVLNVPKSKLTWTMTAAAGTPVQTLPTGIALGSAGLFSGTPTKAPVTSDAALTFTVTVAFKDGTENLSSSAVFKLPFKSGGVVQGVTGDTNSCYLTTVGGVKCAGLGASGENGSGTTGTRVIATDVTGLTSGVAQIDSGSTFVCALTDGGAVKCWGSNSSGELGDGTTTSRSTPVNVSGLTSGVAKVSTGFAHACALMDDQTIKCWGNNGSGRLGNGGTTNQKAPVSIDVGGPVAEVTAGYMNTCALLVSGTVKCWGANTYYQLGDVGTASKTTPFEITGYTGTARQVRTGSGFTCVLNTDDNIQCIGLNLHGRLGDGTTGTISTPKRKFVTALVSDVKMMDSGITNNCAVTNGNAVYCWGDNTYGNVGDGTTTDRATPQRLPELDGKVWTHIDVNDDHQCAASDDGVGMCWGWGGQGRLGNAVDSAKAYAPVTVVF